MKRKGLWIAGIIAAIVIVVLVLLPLLFDANRYRPEIETRLTKSLGRTVKIGDLKLSLFSGGISARDINIADDPAYGKQPFVQAKALKVGVDMGSLLFHQQLQVNSLVLQDPVVRLLQAASGKWNVATLGQKQQGQQGSSSGASDLSVGKVEINNGRIEVGQANGKQQAYDDLNLSATDLSYTKAFPFTVSLKAPQGGKVKVDGEAGPLARDDMSRTPFHGTIDIQNFDLAASGFVNPDSGLAGVLNYQGKVNSDGNRVRSEGKANASKLRLVKTGSTASQPIDVDYHSDYDLARESGTVQNTTIHTGKSAAQLSGTYSSRGAATDLDMHLVANNMATADIEGLLPALGVVLPAGASLQGGTVSSDLQLRGPTDRLVTSGTLKVSNTKLAGFSMGKGLSSIAALAGIQAGSDTNIQLLSSNLRISPDGIRTDNLDLVVPELGSITGSGTIGADSSLNYHLVAKLKAAGGGNAVGLITSALGSKAGPQSIPIQVTGTTAKPVFIPDVGSAIAGQLVPSTGTQQNANPIGGIIGGIFGNKKKK
jgi:AsmA protein